jgi:hypothetical protein
MPVRGPLRFAPGTHRETTQHNELASEQLKHKIDAAQVYPELVSEQAGLALAASRMDEKNEGNREVHGFEIFTTEGRKQPQGKKSQGEKLDRRRQSRAKETTRPDVG